MNTNNKKILGGLLGVLLIVALIFVYVTFREKPVEGNKAITIEVIDQNEKSTTYDVRTDAEFLRQAMEQAEGLDFSGTEGNFGMMVDTVNGVTIDYDRDHAYWSFYVNGEYCNYGIDEQPVEDGDEFQIVYTKQ